jgi:nitrous oxidase accessory protein NosD
MLLPLVVACLSPFVSARSAGAAETVATVIEGGDITTDTTWKGTCRVIGTVRVQPGVTLTLEPGTVVRFVPDSGLGIRGKLRGVGTAERPILLEPDGEPGTTTWLGIEIVEEGQVAIERGRIDRAGAGLKITGGLAELTDAEVTGCGRAVEATMGAGLVLTRCRITGNQEGVTFSHGSTAAVIDSVFEKNENVSLNCGISAGGVKITGTSFAGGNYAMLIKQASDVTVSRCTFSGASLAIGIDQVKTDVRILDNVFSGGPEAVGIRLINLATPYLGCNRFTGFKTAVMAERFSSPLVTHNLFEGNQDGAAGLFKSPFPVRRNVFRGNKRAVFADLASYLTVTGNNFAGNERDMVLGISMSADYERRVGTKGVTKENAEGKGSHNIKFLGQGVENEFPDTVDARGNWWGAATTAEMTKGGDGANITAITDGIDTPLVEYPGWAEGKYRMDRVIYEPWEKGEIPEAGPLAGGCPLDPAQLPK